MRIRLAVLSFALVLTLVLLPSLERLCAAEEAAAPRIEGHVTDPSGMLEPAARAEMESFLDRIQGDTSVDVAAFVASVPGDRAAEAGQQAFVTWGIGRNWAAGVLVTVSSDGETCSIAVSEKRQPLTDAERESIEREARERMRGGRITAGLRVAVERVDAAVRARANVAQRLPGGTPDWARARRFGAAALAVLGLAALVTRWRRRAWARA